MIKYALAAAIVVYVAILLIFTSGSTKSFSAVAKKSRGVSGYGAYEKGRSAGSEEILWSQQCRL